MKKILLKILITFLIIVNVVSITGAKSTSHTYDLSNGLGELGLTIQWSDNSGEYQGFNSYIKKQATSVISITNFPTAYTYSLQFYTKTVFYDSYIKKDVMSMGPIVNYNSGGSSRKIK